MKAWSKAMEWCPPWPTVPLGASVVDVSWIPSGIYQMLVRDRDQQLLARERVVIVH
ncbi:MAG TPA: hypothetical protein VKG92_07295 [Flavobacteriales bacterium]|nr:hypothetical protein [Flavobacteriales bacterium]